MNPQSTLGAFLIAFAVVSNCAPLVAGGLRL
jgi:hypothetical protein